MEGVSRRTVIASGAMGALALKAGWPRAAQAAASAPVQPAKGAVALWTQVDFDRGATFRLAQLDAASRPTRELANATLTADRITSMMQLYVAAQAFAVAAVANSWGVPVDDCRIEERTIKHSSSGQSVHYLAWTDFV